MNAPLKLGAPSDYRKEFMPKRITDRQRIIAYAMQASAEQLQDVIETLKAIQAAKFPTIRKERG